MLQIGGGLDLDQEALGADHRRELGAEDLDRHLAVVSDILGEVDRGHPAGTEFALDAVAVGQACPERVDAHEPAPVRRRVEGAALAASRFASLTCAAPDSRRASCRSG